MVAGEKVVVGLSARLGGSRLGTIGAGGRDDACSGVLVDFMWLMDLSLELSLDLF